MVAKKTGISLELLIHPGETIADVLTERGITQAELAAITGVTPAYVSQVISGKKDISAKFAFALEYALGVPKSFWINLQANYDAELLECLEDQTVTEEELFAVEALKDVISYLCQMGTMSRKQNKIEAVLSLRKELRISDIGNLKYVAPAGAFRMANAAVDPYVLGAWVRLCQIAVDERTLETRFDASKINELIAELKEVMVHEAEDLQCVIRDVMGRYGIDFSIMKNFKGAPVQGYISGKSDGTYQIAMTIRKSFADIFWFSLFHELGHLINGDLGKTTKFIDYGHENEKEDAADAFARDNLINPEAYEDFLFQYGGRFTSTAIEAFAQSQNVKPYIVVGRLQKEKHITYSQFSGYKTRYKWAE